MKVHDGTATMDWMEKSKSGGKLTMTVSGKLSKLFWRGYAVTTLNSNRGRVK